MLCKHLLVKYSDYSIGDRGNYAFSFDKNPVYKFHAMDKNN